MLLYFLAIFCIASVSAHSVLDGNYLVLESDAEELRWAESYKVKATKVYLLSNIVEDFTAWKTNTTSRVDYNDGAVKVITNFGSKKPTKYQIHPETTQEVLNEIVCHFVRDVLYPDAELDDILPPVTEYELYEAVGNETVEEVYVTKFEYNEKNRRKEVRKTIWASYNDYFGWIPIKHEVKEYNVLLGQITDHVIWTFFEYDPDFLDEDVFDTDQYGCSKDSAVEHKANSEKITKELLFIDPDNKEHLDHVFNHFKNKYNREYAHEMEHAFRKSIFDENVRMISSVNRRNLTYKLGVNQFTDWTPEELQTTLGSIPRPEGRVGTVAFPYKESDLDDIVENLPKNYDMRMLGLISPVKNQETCGSCWTFAATAVVEGALARVNGGKVLSLSSQAIVDCAYDELGYDGGGGCNGGFDFAAYDFIMEHGVPTEQEYGPYKNQDGYCHIGNMTKTYRIKGYTDVLRYSSNAMKVAMVNHGPLYVAVHVSKEFFAYSSGIFYQTVHECNPKILFHAVALVGYGEVNGEVFWILRNSGGETWGIDGYMLISAKENVCGVASRPTYPVL